LIYLWPTHLMAKLRTAQEALFGFYISGNRFIDPYKSKAPISVGAFAIYLGYAFYFANDIARFSRMTVTLMCPGYCISS
jgi:vacuolar-type H+-ATPase subunit I/STV1